MNISPFTFPTFSLKPHKNFKTAMPFLWKYCNKDDSKSGYEWCYEEKGCGQYTWAKHYKVRSCLCISRPY